jgi:hypothetical protein
VGQEFDASSDARVKNVIGPSDPASDLAILKRLKITEFRYIDVGEMGRRKRKE